MDDKTGQHLFVPMLMFEYGITQHSYVLKTLSPVGGIVFEMC